MKKKRWNDRVRDILFPVILPLSGLKIRYEVKVVNACELIPNKPVIYACNHSQFSDIPLATRAIGRRNYTLLGKQKLYLIDRIFFNLLGAIWVDRKNKKETAEVKNKILRYLNRGQSILWFPEGTWNLTENMLMLPMRWGIIEVAHKAGGQIVPMAIRYDRKNKKCQVKFSPPLYGEQLADYRNGIQELRDVMAALRWKLMEEYSEVAERKNMHLSDFEKEKEEIIREYPPLDWKYEESVIYEK